MNIKRIKNLFQFIEYLYSNIEAFNQFNNEIEEIIALKTKMYKLNPESNFKEKDQYNIIKDTISKKFQPIKENILQPIQLEAERLMLCNTDQPESLWNRNISEVTFFKENYSKEDLPKIHEFRNKYIEFRKQAEFIRFLGLFFYDLHQICKALFTFFDTDKLNIWDSLESDTFWFNSFEELHNYVINNGVLDKFKNLPDIFSDCPYSNFNFNSWLREKQGLEYEDEMGYKNALSLATYLEFLKETESIESAKKTLQKEKPRIQLEQTKQAETKTETEILTFDNNFDNIKPSEIYKHFKAGLVEKQYLNEQELKEYLKAAFELKTIPETLFKIKDAPNKAAIEAVFYKYYKNVAGKIHRKQKQYAALLGDYFEGYKTTTVSSNFSKSVY